MLTIRPTDEHKNLHLTMNEIFVQALKIKREAAIYPQSDFANHLNNEWEELIASYR